MKSLYYQFVNYIQAMPTGWFLTICLALFSGVLLLTAKFYKIYNGTQKKFEKVSFILTAIILFIILIYLTHIR